MNTVEEKQAPWWKRWFIHPILKQLTQGISADKIAWTIAVGCSLGIFPIMGTTSLVCFAAASVETYRQPDKQRHPGRGRLGPDLGRNDASLAQVIDLLLSYPDREARLRDVLVDQHVMQGVGNVYRCEVLWAAELSPWTHVGDLTHHDAMLIVNTAAKMVRTNQGRLRRTTTTHTPAGLAVYGRCGQGCIRCHETIESRPVGRYGRMLYWCPGWQVRLDRRLPVELREMDPHPAAVKYLNELPWRHRDAG